MESEVRFITISGEQLYFSHYLNFLPRVGERILFPAGRDWYKVTAVYHEIGDMRRMTKHTVIVEKM